MNRLLLSLVFLLTPSVCHAVVPCDAQSSQMRLKYDTVYTVYKPNLKRSYWQIITLQDGTRVLLVVKKQPKRVVKKPVPTLPPVKMARPYRPKYKAPSPGPVTITNPYMEQ